MKHSFTRWFSLIPPLEMPANKIKICTSSRTNMRSHICSRLHSQGNCGTQAGAAGSSPRAFVPGARGTELALEGQSWHWKGRAGTGRAGLAPGWIVHPSIRALQQRKGSLCACTLWDALLKMTLPDT